MNKITLLALLSFSFSLAQNNISEKNYASVEDKVVHWRRDFHQHPELGNREFRTSKIIADYLRSLGIEVKENVAHTGVVGVLKGDFPGKVVALRADMDGLPVSERNDLPFRSNAKGVFNGSDVGVMHACGHDTHISILMGVAEMLSKNKDKIHGTVKFIFQPSEEGAPIGEEGGAALMIKEGVLQNPDVDVIFGLHINSETPNTQIKYTPEGAMASSQRFVIKVHGKQSHGSQPWSGVDPIMISAKIIDGLQTIISREARLTDAPAVITVGKITSGVRFNIIPEEAEMVGTIRTLSYEMRDQIDKRIIEMSQDIAKAYGATADVEIAGGTSITYNEPKLLDKMLPTMKRVAGEENVLYQKPITGAEDFSFFQDHVPGIFFFLGGMTPGNKEAFPHHTPDFKIDDSNLILGVKTLSEMTIDYLNSTFLRKGLE